MGHICARGLTNLRKWGLLYDEKFGFCECIHGKQHGCVDFGDFVLLCPSKQIVQNRDLGIQFEVELECGMKFHRYRYLK